MFYLFNQHYTHNVDYANLLLDAFWLVVVAALWGGTNPLLKKGGEGIEKMERNNFLTRTALELLFLVTNWKVCF